MTTTAQRDKRIAAVDKAIERYNERSEKAMVIVNEAAVEVTKLHTKREWLLAMPTDDSLVDRDDVEPVQIFSSSSNGEVPADSYR